MAANTNPEEVSSSTQIYSGTITPDSEPRSATLLTENGPLEVCIVKSKAVPEPSGKFRCPVPNCDYGSHSRIRITKHFHVDHKNYRSWRDVFLRKDAPHFIVKKNRGKLDEEGTSTPPLDRTNVPLQSPNTNPLESLQKLAASPASSSAASSPPMEIQPNSPPSTLGNNPQNIPSQNNAPNCNSQQIPIGIPLQPQAPFIQTLGQQFLPQPGLLPMMPPQGLFLPMQQQQPQYKVIQVLVPSRLVQSGPPISLCPSPERPYTLLPLQKVGSSLLPALNEPRILLSQPHTTIPVVTPTSSGLNQPLPPTECVPNVIPLIGPHLSFHHGGGHGVPPSQGPPL
ncbi:uncharacterized protein [Lepeophtheirus salmonis]|uniref:uncharacterized protein n=1 Tax=Lepeophtheirus salmonis TaxID=72036 RepID=UPI001AEABC53|nr:proline-rich protein 36-like [Lepeophtheirus salmonis]